MATSTCRLSSGSSSNWPASVHLGADAAHPVRPSTPMGVIPEQAAPQIVLQCRGISMRFGKGSDSTVALEQIDLDVARGEFLVLLGPSGCGKSTLLQIIAGLEAPSGGRLRFLRGDGGRKLTSMVFQEYALFPWRTVLENVVFGPEVRKVPRATRDVEAQRLV